MVLVREETLRESESLPKGNVYSLSEVKTEGRGDALLLIHVMPPQPPIIYCHFGWFVLKVTQIASTLREIETHN